MSSKRHLFKNAFTVSSQSVMRGSDVKKLKQKVMDKYKGVTIEQIDSLINKKKDIGIVKLPNKIQLISHQNDPIFFEFNDAIYPTVYTFFKIPTFLTVIYIYPQVYHYIESGADLMFQGILNKNDVPKVQGSLVSICLRGSNFPIAYGETIQDLTIVNTALTSPDTTMPEYKGKAISIIHYLNDKLWEYGTKKLPDNFKSKEFEQQENDDDDEEDDEEDGDGDDSNNNNKFKETTTSTSTATPNTQSDITNNMDGLKIKDVSDNDSDSDSDSDKENTTTTTTTTTTKPTPTITKEEMDEILLISFLGAIKKGITDSELPMVLKTVFTKHMLYYQPKDRYEISIKKSSYKKVSVFLKEMQKQGFIELKEPTPGNIVLSRINRNNPIYGRFKLGEIVGPTMNQNNSGDNSDDENGDGDSSDDDDTFGSTQKEFIQIKCINEVYSMPKQLKDYLNEKNSSQEEKDSNDIKKKYYLSSEIQKLVSSYIIENKLEDPQKRSKIKLDTFLNKLVPNSLIQKSMDVNGLIEKNSYFMAFKDHSLKRYLEINRVDDSKEFKEYDQIVIQVKKIANRFVILVSNLELFSIPIKELANEGQKLFAASTSIEKLNSQKSTLKIQGNDLNRVSQHIQKKYSIPKKYISEIDFNKKK
ncbi:hypothetical protein RB653_008175 [Dictyostelium firmibasis]|uniref:SUI1 domain-containing protein n=1 Tax=Dictyostelium firmibasis TaxID=79012 RepID=A0AAN7TZB3_9MYCE